MNKQIYPIRKRLYIYSLFRLTFKGYIEPCLGFQFEFWVDVSSLYLSRHFIMTFSISYIIGNLKSHVICEQPCSKKQITRTVFEETFIFERNNKNIYVNVNSRW